jgi:hypothetical protein
MKTCRICNETKPLDGFYVVPTSRDGFCHMCKKCSRARQAARFLANPEKARAYQLRLREYSPKDFLRQKAEAARKWRANNPGKKRAATRNGQAAKLKRTPSWADQAAILAIYREASSRRANGENVHVDHILPLCGRLVSGLHVAANLRIISARENLTKGCKFDG